MLFGRKPRLVGDVLLNINLADFIPDTSFSRSYLENLQLVHQICREGLKFKEVYDRKHRVLTSLEEGDVVLLQKLKESSNIDNILCESPYVVLNRPDINVPVYDIKELSTGSMKTRHRNQLLLLFQTEGVVEPHLVKKKLITEAVSDHVSEPDNHVDTSLVSAYNTSTSDNFKLAPRLIPSDVDSDSSNTSHPEPHPLGGAPDEFSGHMDSDTLSDSKNNQESVAG